MNFQYFLYLYLCLHSHEYFQYLYAGPGPLSMWREFSLQSGRHLDRATPTVEQPPNTPANTIPLKILPPSSNCRDSSNPL